MKKHGVSSREGFKKPTPHNLTCQSMEDLIAKIMEANKITKMFQVMVVVNYKMGNLGLQISTLTNILLSAKQEPRITKVKEERCESTSNFKECRSHMGKKKI